MSLEMLLTRLEGVRRTGNDRWIAHCPAHDDRHPSLAIRLADDGRVLLHDFAGCDTESVLASIGLTFADLFPERRPGDRVAPVRQPFNARDILACLAFEGLVVVQFARQLLRGTALSPADQERLLLAVRRFLAAERMINNG